MTRKRTYQLPPVPETLGSGREPVTLREISERLDYPLVTVREWAYSGARGLEFAFPPPRWRRGRLILLWDWSLVLAWAERTGRVLPSQIPNLDAGRKVW